VAPFDLGKLLLILGLIIAAVGGGLIVGRRLGLGQLPGDISGSAGSVSFYVPIVTCIVISVVLTIVLNIVLRLRG
jgi:Protein of unknown function (DUF2905)